MKQLFAGIVFLFLFISSGSAQTFITRVVKDNLFIPWEIIYSNWDSSIWFTQKNGYILRLEPISGNIDTLYHQPLNVIRGEGGMMGMAINPNFPAEPYVYVAYMYEDGSNYRKRIVRLTYNNGALSGEQILLNDIPGANIHNGCRLLIVGDKLFVTTGDVANTATAQNPTNISGKILRINLDGSIPSDNPITGNPVWSWGHRNPQGLTHYNGILYSSEHGANSDDEINIITGAKNYGWPNVQGFCNTPSEITYCTDSAIIEPLMAWTPTLAVSGIEHYHHSMFPDFNNSLLMTTLKDNNLYKLQLSANGDSIVSAQTIPNIAFGRLRDIAIAPDGRMFISTSNSPSSGAGAHNDRIIELVDTTTPPTNNIFENKQSAISLYPNPAKEFISVSFKNFTLERKSWRYEITNVQGQIVDANTFIDSRINVSELPAGLYHLRITQKDSDTTFRHKFVKVQ